MMDSDTWFDRYPIFRFLFPHDPALCLLIFSVAIILGMAEKEMKCLKRDLNPGQLSNY